MKTGFRTSRDDRRETLKIDGLDAPAEIAVDRWGIPHISASSTNDLFFLQGFNAARDRLWQIDLWRKRGLGLLSADFGAGYLMQDRAARMFLYRGDMDREWSAYGCEDARAICEAFTRGVNAYVDLTEREPARLPLEFHELGTRPSHWKAEDVARIRSHGLIRNALAEILRATIVKRGGADASLLLSKLEPPTDPSPFEWTVLDWLDLDVLDAFRLATSAVNFTDERLSCSLADAARWTQLDDFGKVVQSVAMEGSNNWAVHGSRTVSGRPIVANDPHRAYTNPSLRYLVHLRAPGIDVIGAGEPALPGISLGHNDAVAFGVTVFRADQEDVYVYETQDEHPDQYRYGEGYEAATVIEETISVRGAPDQNVLLKFTRHGPIVHESRGRAVAVRSVWFEPGAAPYLASLSLMRARDFGEFRQSLNAWVSPMLNMVYGDVEGNIAWRPAGKIPKRPNWNGLLPVPGDGRYEWDGFIDPELLPWRINPPEGFVASANEMNVPSDWPHEQFPIGHEWAEPSRARRIHEALSSGKLHDVASSCALQTDCVSIPARRLVRLLQKFGTMNGYAGVAFSLLQDWDCNVGVDSAAGALFEIWWTRHLRPQLLRMLVTPEIADLLLPGDIERTLEILEEPDVWFAGFPETERDRLLLRSLADAVQDCASTFGADPTTWRWGDLHQVYFEHALADLQGVTLPLNVGPLPVGGSSSTTMLAAYRTDNFRVTAGASVRIVMDVGAWDESVCINVPGQSGDSRSPYYGDLAASWAKGSYVPLLYSRAKIEPEIVERIILTPDDSVEASP